LFSVNFLLTDIQTASSPSKCNYRKHIRITLNVSAEQWLINIKDEKQEKADTPISAKTHAGENPAWLIYAASGKQIQKSDAGKTRCR